MNIHQEYIFTGELLKADDQDKQPVNITNGKILFCSNGEVLIQTNQELYNDIQAKIMFESSPLYQSPVGPIIRPAYEGNYKLQGEAKKDKTWNIKATVSRDTGIKPDIWLQEVHLEREEVLTSEEHSFRTVYGLIAFEPFCNIDMPIYVDGSTLTIEKDNNDSKKVLEANVCSKLSIFSHNLSIEAQEKLAYFLICMISFAFGRKIYEAYQRDEVKSGDISTVKEYWRGSRSRAVAKGFVIIQEPHLKLFLKQLIDKEAHTENYRNSLFLSLSWYLETFESDILATNFVLLCTAIEALNEELKKIQQTGTNRLLSKAKYREVRKAMLQCIDQHSPDIDEDKTLKKYEMFKTKVKSVFSSGSLNTISSLSASLQNMLEYFKVRYDDLFPKFDFIKIRNNVVHRGTHDFGEMFYVYLKLENLYIRLILCVLEYDGNYMEHDGTGLICRTVPFKN
ncbi:MAG: hypothetical protein WA999_23725 [Spirulinaceae cyanobacterium]